MNKKIKGIHHITAIANDAKKNVDFYTKILGLRLIKVTVNFDDPSAYHLYYGDELGHPGTALTFFIYSGSSLGKPGHGQVSAIAFSIPENTTQFWMDHLKKNKIPCKQSTRFEEQVILFSDHDGLPLELVAHRGASKKYVWGKGTIADEFAIRGFHSVTLCEEGYESSAEILKILGFRQEEKEGSRFRFIGEGDVGNVIDITVLPDAKDGFVSVGSVHHVAFRCDDDLEQKHWHDLLTKHGMNVTPMIDRKYFHSIYFREPGNVLFEIATDGPGFTVDEKPEDLGKKLVLPDWYESMRAKIEKMLPSLADD